MYSHFNRCFPLICARYASKIWAFPNQMNIVKILSSGVARQHRKACDDLSALLFYGGFSYLRYYKQNNADVKVYKRYFQILDMNSFHYTLKKNKIFNKFRGHAESCLNRNPSLDFLDITHAQYTYTYLLTGRISKLGLHSLKSYTCVRITSWVTLVYYSLLAFKCNF